MDKSLLLGDQGISRHYPTIQSLSNSLYDLMVAISGSRLNKQHLYKHLLKAADFASNLLQSEAIFQLARALDNDTKFFIEKSLADTLQSHQFLKKTQVSKACLNLIKAKFRPNSEQLLINLIIQEFEKTPIKRVFFRTKIEPKHCILFDFQLDVTLSFVLMCFYAFTQGVVLEAFDEYENVEIQQFQFKEFAFNAAAAPKFVNFWFPAFSKDDKVIFQARFIENNINYDIAGDDEDFQDVMTFQSELGDKQAVRESIHEKPNFKEMVAEEVAKQLEPLKQQVKSMEKKIKNLTDQNSILSASQQKILLDFDKMFTVVRELNDSIVQLASQRKK